MICVQTSGFAWHTWGAIHPHVYIIVQCATPHHARQCHATLAYPSLFQPTLSSVAFPILYPKGWPHSPDPPQTSDPPRNAWGSQGSRIWFLHGGSPLRVHVDTYHQTDMKLQQHVQIQVHIQIHVLRTDMHRRIQHSRVQSNTMT